MGPRKFLPVVIFFTLTGCSILKPKKPEPVIEIREVPKIIKVKAEPPLHLIACTRFKRESLPKFSAPPEDGKEGARLDRLELMKLKIMLHALNECDRAWIRWSTP